MPKFIDTSSRLPAVKSAVKLLTIGLLIMVAKFPFSKKYGISDDYLASIFEIVLIAIINAFLFYKILTGANWARVILLVSFVAGEVPFSLLAFFQFEAEPVISVLTAIGLSLDFYAIFLLFSQPASLWFKKEK